ncbi:hypothetical protein QTO34_011468 [Cnephaeus nilssonii]|uniref:Uncharacterized protein n=1 Tax=Cnephaeus nilssonii TaxID=3371016 RepID=A0AA40HDL1_CNENI|nr:hypothetical protein QTO34_011468 [Eptesicus nilssonii]
MPCCGGGVRRRRDSGGQVADWDRGKLSCSPAAARAQRLRHGCAAAQKGPLGQRADIPLRAEPSKAGELGPCPLGQQAVRSLRQPRLLKGLVHQAIERESMELGAVLLRAQGLQKPPAPGGTSGRHPVPGSKAKRVGDPTQRARDYLHKTGRFIVIGGIVSPVHDSYGKQGALPLPLFSLTPSPAPHF